MKKKFFLHQITAELFREASESFVTSFSDIERAFKSSLQERYFQIIPTRDPMSFYQKNKKLQQKINAKSVFLLLSGPLSWPRTIIK